MSLVLIWTGLAVINMLVLGVMSGLKMAVIEDGDLVAVGAVLNALIAPLMTVFIIGCLTYRTAKYLGSRAVGAKNA